MELHVVNMLSLGGFGTSSRTANNGPSFERLEHLLTSHTSGAVPADLIFRSSSLPKAGFAFAEPFRYDISAAAWLKEGNCHATPSKDIYQLPSR
jgi:hypothetical protein